MKKGESFIFIRPEKGYRISYLLPCVLEKGKKMAEARIDLAITPEELFSVIEKHFTTTKYYPDLPAAHVEWEGKKMVIHTGGDKKPYALVKIMKAKDKDDVIKTTDMLSILFSKNSLRSYD